MSLLQIRLFLRIATKGKEVYLLKIVSMSIAFACSTLIALFSLHEFRYDRFHADAHSVFRVLQKNNSEAHLGNRLSNKVPEEVLHSLRSSGGDSLRLSRVKLLGGLSIATAKEYRRDQKIHATDDELTRVFKFRITDGSLSKFAKEKKAALLSESAARKYFGTDRAAGNSITIISEGDSLIFSVAAVYEDFPENSHEAFQVLIRFDASALRFLSFNPAEFALYGRVLYPEHSYFKSLNKIIHQRGDMTYLFQPLPEIYFGPRVVGEDTLHGDYYSIFILISITGLILFLALTGYVNLTTLTLPYRAKEIAVKKLTGISQRKLLNGFILESFAVVGISSVIGIFVLVVSSDLLEPLLSINIISFLVNGNRWLGLVWAVLFILFAISPIFVVLKFTRATPNRLLSTEAITFPRFKRIITFIQLGTSIFLIVASMVIRRQINYSLLKEPGRNYDQIVYLRYPKDLTGEGLRSLRESWKKYHPNIMNVMAASQLPDQVRSKEVNSPFYFMSVDPSFNEFFDLNMIRGNWFKPNDGDSIVVMNEKAYSISGADKRNAIGVFQDFGGRFNLPEKPVRINIAPYFNYNFLLIRVLEVDIRRTIDYLSRYFQYENRRPSISFLDKNFGRWLHYQDRLNTLSGMLAIISSILSCCAIYGLSLSIVRDKLKQIAIHKLFGAGTFKITRLLINEFTPQMVSAILIFGPFTYFSLKELLRSFVYATHFNWIDPILPLAYCGAVIFLLCGFQAWSLNREDLSGALKG